MSTRRLKFAAIGVAVLLGAAAVWGQQGARGGEWTRYGADGGVTKYAPLDQIDKQNGSRGSGRPSTRASPREFRT